MTRFYFDWYYWCVNIGAFVSLGGVAYIQQEIDFGYGYLIPFICLLLSVIFYLAGNITSNLSPIPCELVNMV